MTDFELYEYSENKLKEKEKRIAELEKENAELKNNNKVYCEGEGETLVVNVSFDKFTRINANKKMFYPNDVKQVEQLTKAKDIMKRLVDLSNSSRSILGDTWFDTLREAERFLKDCEVEK